MDVTCTRCNQSVLADNCYCPNCGMPQLVYAAEGMPAPVQPEMLHGVVRDASMVDWKAALRMAALLAIPAGFLSSADSPLKIFSIVWMAGAASLAVTLYMRGQRPAWITMGAGARIGLVTGLIAAWVAFSASGGELFIERFVLHQASQFDAEWKASLEVSEQFSRRLVGGMSQADALQFQDQQAKYRAMMLSPEGEAAGAAFGLAVNGIFLLLFAVGGGLLGARMISRTARKPEV
jgi:hypothetical protein